MKQKIHFPRSHFVTSALHPKEWPPLSLPEIALIGRSNVGKSSLINHLLETKNLAKTSQKPGKTQRINFFSVDETFFLVDLPGYGYAAASKEKQKEWSHFLDLYMRKRPLQGLLLLFDMRRELTNDDELFLSWTQEFKVPSICLLTKADKLSLKEQRTKMSQFEKRVKNPLFSYSIKEGKCRSSLKQEIQALISSQGDDTWD